MKYLLAVVAILGAVLVSDSYAGGRSSFRSSYRLGLDDDCRNVTEFRSEYRSGIGAYRSRSRFEDSYSDRRDFLRELERERERARIRRELERREFLEDQYLRDRVRFQRGYRSSFRSRFGSGRRGIGFRFRLGIGY